MITDDTLADLDDVVEPITSTLKVKLKDQATKQDVEKSTELQRSLFRGKLFARYSNRCSTITDSSILLSHGRPRKDTPHCSQIQSPYPRCQGKQPFISRSRTNTLFVEQQLGSNSQCNGGRLEVMLINSIPVRHSLFQQSNSPSFNQSYDNSMTLQYRNTAFLVAVAKKELPRSRRCPGQ
jgi:hypothetical protein